MPVSRYIVGSVVGMASVFSNEDNYTWGGGKSHHISSFLFDIHKLAICTYIEKYQLSNIMIKLTFMYPCIVSILVNDD